mmetsp:Transcript_94785/g.306006  ORF Transcript_94785/g.306006 Transcript_94785/m.306006 type:complete len:255 (+) Transcript_94785:383-1147(+)
MPRPHRAQHVRRHPLLGHGHAPHEKWQGGLCDFRDGQRRSRDGRLCPRSGLQLEGALHGACWPLRVRHIQVPGGQPRARLGPGHDAGAERPDLHRRLAARRPLRPRALLLAGGGGPAAWHHAAREDPAPGPGRRGRGRAGGSARARPAPPRARPGPRGARSLGRGRGRGGPGHRAAARDRRRLPRGPAGHGPGGATAGGRQRAFRLRRGRGAPTVGARAGEARLPDWQPGRSVHAGAERVRGGGRRRLACARRA